MPKAKKKNPLLGSYLPSVYQEAAALFDSYHVEDITSGGRADVIVDTLVSMYGNNDEDSCELLGLARTEDNLEWACDEAAECLQAEADRLNATLPKQEWRAFTASWQEGALVLMFGGDVADRPDDA